MGFLRLLLVRLLSFYFSSDPKFFVSFFFLTGNHLQQPFWTKKAVKCVMNSLLSVLGDFIVNQVSCYFCCCSSMVLFDVICQIGQEVHEPFSLHLAANAVLFKYSLLRRRANARNVSF
ncbi:hypothetical protein OS493_017983 [Desmophyllum pertusum]|uniref:Uncharacterized protein n=1 Tax=Desmophyllum pertusum TaxID=174260 RepID=A0A9W9Z1N0_9CNID|nr:hypothetical protein OS493_017983 [Desmophyllum pertusum]